MLHSCMHLPHQNAAPPLAITEVCYCRSLSCLSVSHAALPCSQPCLPRLLKGFPKESCLLYSVNKAQSLQLPCSPPIPGVFRAGAGVVSYMQGLKHPCTCTA